MNVSCKYIPLENGFKEKEDSVKLQGQYMGGMCKYIELMGEINKDYLKDTWKYYLQE